MNENVRQAIETVLNFFQDFFHAAKQVAITKGDLLAAGGAGVSGGIWGYTQHEWAAISTIIICAVIVISKLFSMWIEWLRFKHDTR